MWCGPRRPISFERIFPEALPALGQWFPDPAGIKITWAPAGRRDARASFIPRLSQ